MYDDGECPIGDASGLKEQNRTELSGTDSAFVLKLDGLRWMASARAPRSEFGEGDSGVERENVITGYRVFRDRAFAAGTVSQVTSLRVTIRWAWGATRTQSRVTKLHNA